MNTPSVKNVMRDEYKKLVAQRDELDKKINALEMAINVYSNRVGSTVNHRSTAGDSEFTNLVRSIFEKNQNKPLQLKDIISQVTKLNPELDEQKAGNKMFAVIRNRRLEKVSYGKYIFKGLSATEATDVNL